MVNDVKKDYFSWMLEKVGATKRRPSYFKLLNELYETEFEFYIEMDGNRYDDGIDLRYRYAYENNISYGEIAIEMDRQWCSILEMMVALAIDCEEHIMYDPEIGERTSYWFWGMIDSLGLTNQDDDHYKPATVKHVIKKFLKREYKPNGSGGLFTLKHPREDLRKVEIWYQLNWYLDEVIEGGRR